MVFFQFFKYFLHSGVIYSKFMKRDASQMWKNFLFYKEMTILS